VFNLRNPEENGAFLNLVQHLGYPTPLLDWTYSPYVAAFFAYRKSRGESDPNKRVRILVLDQRWRTEIQQLMFAERAFPHFSIGEFMAIENEPSVPQESVSAITNVDDIET
jgi:FRG domain